MNTAQHRKERSGVLGAIRTVIGFLLGYAVRLGAPFIAYGFHTFFTNNKDQMVTYIKGFTIHAYQFPPFYWLWVDLFVVTLAAAGALVYSAYALFQEDLPGVKWVMVPAFVVTLGVYVYATFYLTLFSFQITALAILDFDDFKLGFLITAVNIILILPLLWIWAGISSLGEGQP